MMISLIVEQAVVCIPSTRMVYLSSSPILSLIAVENHLNTIDFI